MSFERDSANPILTRADIPPARSELVDVTSVFNPGAIRRDGRDHLLLRVQTRGRETRLMVAEETGAGSARFKVRPEVVRFDGLDPSQRGIFHVYDPRLTRIDDAIYVVFAADTADGCRLGIARTVDLERFELISFDAGGERRNGVLFPRRIGGRYLRLERPNVHDPDGGAGGGDEIVLAESDDLVDWRRAATVMRGRLHFWDERIGSGPPPIETGAGWLHVYHGVATHFGACNIYQAGVVLLDLEDPARVLGRSRLNVLEPRETYELVGQVPNVVFPTGMTVDVDDDRTSGPEPRSPVRLYYGAADTCVGLATTTIASLIAACDPAPPRAG